MISDRRFVIHGAHHAIGVSTVSPTLPMIEHPCFASPSPQTDTRVRLCLLSGSPADDSDASLSTLGIYLEQHFDVACSKAFRRTRRDLPGVENLADCDCAVVWAQRLAIDGEQLGCLRRFCDRGGAVVALAGMAGAFENWPQWEAEVLGGQPQPRPAAAGLSLEVAPFAEGHPILHEVRLFAPAVPPPGFRQTSSDSTVLLVGSAGLESEPLAWIRVGGRGRTFVTTLGHPGNFRRPNFLRLLANAVHWATGRPLA